MSNGEYLTADDLLEQPDNVLFYEVNADEPVIYRKIATYGGDVVVHLFDRDFEKSRLGLPEMDSAIRDGKKYHVYTKDELRTIAEFFNLAYLQSRTSFYNSNVFAR
jgi:hypothetical protein